ncbi:MAG: HNH endonuclease [Calothrix sp. MO_167.B12]|nr:HNH endonuclease [Calothrix sp. MO_167.B12]
METFEAKIIEIATKQPNPEAEYYSITFTANSSGEVFSSCYSHFVGWENLDRRIELRAASLVKANRMLSFYRSIGEICLVIDSLEDVAIFLLFGGHGLVEKTVAENALPDQLKPQPCVATTPFGRFKHTLSLPKEVFNRAPSPKQRMRVMQRDDFRCRVCGRRSADYVDVELHIHHIRPWAQGGITQDENLITLCHTCHKGLDPHYNLKLFDLISSTGIQVTAEQLSEQYWQGVRQYQETITKILSGEADVGKKTKQRKKAK